MSTSITAERREKYTFRQLRRKAKFDRIVHRTLDQIERFISKFYRPKIYSRFWFLPLALFSQRYNLGTAGFKIGFGAGFFYGDITITKRDPSLFGHVYLRIHKIRLHSSIFHITRWRKQW